MPVITISRQFCAGGLTLGKQLGEMLNLILIDDEVINLYRKFEKSDDDLPHRYHLTLNMNRPTLKAAADIISRPVTHHGS
jgi:hypothetical protein